MGNSVTGIYQYLSMNGRTYTALSKVAPLPVVAEVVMFFNVAAFGLALALADNRGRLGPGRPPDMGSTLVAASPLVIFQIFTNFDALAAGLATSGLLAWARRRPVLVGVLIGLEATAKLYRCCSCTRCCCLGIPGRSPECSGPHHGDPRAATQLLNLPVTALSARLVRFFRLNTPRGDDMDSLYNVVEVVHRQQLRPHPGLPGRRWC